jgi:SAM-dependent methyltransferase
VIQPDNPILKSPTRASCRVCNTPLPEPFLDLGQQPLCESFLPPEQLNEMEPFYPLTVFVCRDCLLVQLQAYVSPEHIFTEYAYFSSYSDSWLKHAKAYVAMVVDRFGLNRNSLAVELASNDGYLLQYFKDYSVPVLGIEPAANVAEVAVQKGVPTAVKFFGVKTANEQVAAGHTADLIIGNNVLAQVPDLHDFVGGMPILLKQNGVITLEFPHLLTLLQFNQFDTIYHEHFSYFSLNVIERLFAAHGLRVFDVEEIPTQGGSLRIYGCHKADSREENPRVEALRKKEKAAELDRWDTYTAFANRVQETKRDLLAFLIQAKREGKRIAGYGAAGKGNTLLNYCGIRTDFLDYLVDRNPYKHGRFTPGTHIPILTPDKIAATKPDYVLILPWNLKDEIMSQISYIRDWGAKFMIPIPKIKVVE